MRNKSNEFISQLQSKLLISIDCSPINLGYVLWETVQYKALFGCLLKRLLSFIYFSRTSCTSRPNQTEMCAGSCNDLHHSQCCRLLLERSPASNLLPSHGIEMHCRQTWNLSKILHRQIFRLKVLHRKSA